ncbi:MAG: class I mannose-6-phosphate isomerase [Phycisphaerales bacterium]|nr:class I mannose-6-phosphate isomerase [Phycisphaerales bacterium]
MTELYPLVFTSILRPKVWGGRALERLNKPLPPADPIGESWEIADLPSSIPDGQSVVANGPLAGRTLGDVRMSYPEDLLGHALESHANGFPLLVKYLDARENLSVQVHPTPSYVRRHPETHLKSEAWFIVAAEPGSVIYKGIRPEISRETFADHIAAGSVVDDLVAMPARAGECHYLPSGTCHALGAGVLVAEIQTPSDTTFRVFDWNRKGRELHIDEALECIVFGEEPSPAATSARPAQVDGWTVERLVKTEFFAIDRVNVVDAIPMEVATNGLPRVQMVIAGQGRIEGPEDVVTPVRAGSTVLLPAGIGQVFVRLEASACMLDVTVPGPSVRMLA